MKPLLEFAERAEVKAFVGSVTKSNSVQGVIVDYDPLWLTLWRIRSTFGDVALEGFVDRMFYLRHMGPPWTWDFNSLSELFGIEGGEIEPPDPKWIPPLWAGLKEQFGISEQNDEPFIVKVCLLPWQGNESVPELGKYQFRVVKERRSPAALTMPLRKHRPVVGGISIGLGPTDSGTLGGIVEDQNNKRWGVTCAHVLQNQLDVDQPAKCDNSLASSVGTASHKSVLASSPSTAPCNPYNSASLLNSIDAALIEFSSGTNSDLQVLNNGTLSGIMGKGTPSPGQVVDIAGKHSGPRVLEIGGLAITYRLRDSTGNIYCFKDLFELRWPRWWRGIGGRPVQHGDSGAWVLASQASGTEWVGMALAGDRLVGYAMFAENIVDWAKASCGLNLSVV